MLNQQIFQRTGQYEGSDALAKSLAAEGYLARRRVSEAKVASATRLFADVLSGKEDPIFFREALNPTHEFMLAEIEKRYPGVLGLRETMSVTDFANYLTVTVLDRVLYGYYTTAEVPVMPLVKQVPLRDFRQVMRLQVDGAVTPFEKQGSPAVPPAQRALTPVDPIYYNPDLYQGYMSVNWRAIVNDDLGIFKDMIQRLATSWNLTVWKFITGLYMSSTGPNAALYKAGFSNLITTAYGAASTNPPLSFQGLIDGITVLTKMLSPDGQPIIFPGKLYLWHGPALHTTAMALTKALMADISVGGGTTNGDGFPSQRLRVGTDYIVGNLIPLLDKYIPIVCTTGTVAATAWGLTYEPDLQARPSIEFGMLRGFETPQLFQKAPNTMRAAGGLDPMMGDFLTMDTDYKAIAVFGGTQVDGRSTVASTGQGS